jgi:hypothetical protein
VEVLVQQLGASVASETTLFPEIQPKWIDDAKESPSPIGNKLASSGFDATSLKPFPDQFLSDVELDVEDIELPTDELKISQDRNGTYFVTDESGFRREVRNEVEAKFFVYAQLRGVTKLQVPRNVRGIQGGCRLRKILPRFTREARARS